MLICFICLVSFTMKCDIEYEIAAYEEVKYLIEIKSTCCDRKIKFTDRYAIVYCSSYTKITFAII